MNNLLSAQFQHLKKFKIFWICCIVMMLIGFIIACNTDNEGGVYLDNIFFTYSILIGIALSVFISLFIGTEYSDGTIRNKMIVGCSRITVYFSNLFICFFAGLIMCCFFLLPMCTIGMARLGVLKCSLQAACLMILISMMLILALTSIFTLIAILITSKALSAVVSILGIFFILFCSVLIKSNLEEPEYYDGYTYIDAEGAHYDEPMKNPNYLDGTKREVYQFVLDYLPTGQALEVMMWEIVNPGLALLYSLSITVITTSAGVLVFRKKDLK